MREKTYGYGYCVPADRKEKQRVSAYARAYNARHRQPGQHIGPLTRTYLDVLDALLWGFHNATTGRCFPSYERIAEKAGCVRSTVHKAIVALEAAGVLTWQQRRVRHYGRVFRTSNAYRFRSASENPAGTRNQEIQLLREPRIGSFGFPRDRIGPVAPIRTVAEQIALLNTGVGAMSP